MEVLLTNLLITQHIGLVCMHVEICMHVLNFYLEIFICPTTKSLQSMVCSYEIPDNVLIVRVKLMILSNN